MKEAPMSTDETVRIPGAVKKILNQGERVIAAITQSRMREMTTPDTIVVTDQRIIRCAPSAFGLRNEIQGYLYEDMANFVVQKGLMFATMTIRHRMMSDDLVIGDLPKGQMDKITKAVNEAIRRARSAETTPHAAGSSPTE